MIKACMKAGVAALALAMAAGAAEAQATFIVNGKVWTGTEAGTIENGTVVIEGGRITSVGAGIAPPPGAVVYDAEGQWVTPGIIAPMTRVGIVEVGAERSTNDTSAGGSDYSVALKASDGFNPAATPVPVTRIEGVTRVVVAPDTGSSIFAGQGFVADTSGAPDSITLDDAFVYVELGAGGASEAGGSRPAAWAYFRAALSDARTYPARYVAHDQGDALKRVDAIAFGPASRGQQLILVHVERASDIRKVIALAEERPELRLAIYGASEGWLVADELAASGIPVIINPINNLPASFEMLGATMENAQRLIDAGVLVAFQADGDDSHQARLTLQSAGNAVANGVPYDEALEAITGAPAAIFGLTGLGDLRAGAVADVVVWDGDPLEITSAPVRIWIDGVQQSLQSRQTRLRDRYRSLAEDEKPKAYTRP